MGRSFGLECVGIGREHGLYPSDRSSPGPPAGFQRAAGETPSYAFAHSSVHSRLYRKMDSVASPRSFHLPDHHQLGNLADLRSSNDSPGQATGVAMIGELFAAGVRLFTGVQARWLGCPPDATQRVYFANHTSNLDFL